MAEAVERTDEEKARAFAAMTGMISVIDNVLDDDNKFGNDLTKEEKKERIMRTAGYMSYQKALDDWGSEDFTAIDAAIKKAEDYDPSA
jgi:c-di-GMP-related signal transduction protein